jgi:hypothetical protein
VIRIFIGDGERTLEQASESWIREQVISRRKADGSVCVRVSIRAYGVDMLLATPGCPASGGGRPPNAKERDIFTIWEKLGLDKVDFEVSHLIAFLSRVRD